MDILLNKGDFVKTSLTDSTLVLKVEGNDALLFTGSQFVVAHGIQKENDHVFWLQGEYYDELPANIFEKDKKRNTSVKEGKLDLNEEQGKNSRVFIIENSTEMNIRTDSELETDLEDDWELEP